MAAQMEHGSTNVQEAHRVYNPSRFFEVENDISVYKERDYYEHEERSDHRLLRLDDVLV
jgi:hypothetical protein